MVRWNDTFWGEGNRGFEVLSTNVKNGAIAIEEFQRFLNESSQYESAYCKNLSRLQSQLLKVQHVGTFTPIWQSIRDLLEKIAQTHLSTVTYYQDLLREIHNYHDSYQKKVKTSIQKDPDITRTADLVSQLNNALNTLNKAKEQYHSIGLDYERAKRSGNNLTNGTSTPIPQDNNTSSSLAQTAFNTLTSATRQFERLEKKYRQSFDDYKTSVEKYNSLRNEFEKRFYDACTKFQDFEGEHVEKMLSFSLHYSEILKRNNEQTRLAQNEFQERIKQFTGTDLIEAFVEQKKTGIERPAPIQFEELDNIKSSLNLTNLPSSVTPDSSAGLPDELITFEQSEAGVPTFQAHFPVSSPTMLSGWPSTTNMKKSESNRALASNTAINHQHILPNNQSSSSLFNTTPMSLSNPNNPLARLQENSNEPSSNPFDVKIRRPAFKGFWPSNRKDKKGDKKKSNNSKSNKTEQVQPPQVPDETSSISSANDTNGFHKMIGSMDGLNEIPSNIQKTKCPTPEPYTQSSPQIPNSGINRPGCQSTIPFSSAAMRKSTSSSDSSDDDDDDFRTSKIQFKINPTTQKSPIAEENDDAKISNAMRRVEKSIGLPSTYSRVTGRDEKLPDLSKSISIGQIGARIPPPLPSRPPSTLSTSVTTDNLGPIPSSPQPTSLVNTFDGIETRSKSMSVSSNHQENIPPAFVHPRSMTNATESKKLTSISSTDDDTEVANTFPGDASTSKTAPFAVSRPPRVRQSFPQQPTTSTIGPSIANGRMTPFIAPNTSTCSNSLMTSLDHRMSPITIGATDQIPIAVAFQETIHVMMSGDDQTKWKIRILGDMLISFPAAILNILVEQSPHLNTLEFRLQNLSKVENVIANPQLVSQKPSATDLEGSIYTFNMSALSNILRNLQEKNRSLPFFNFGILKYEVKHSGISNIPFEVSSQWTRTIDTISVNINYRFNSSALPDSIRLVNDTVTFYTNISDGQQITHSTPSCEWSLNEHKLSWKVPYIFDGSGSLSATLMTNQSGSDGSDNEQQSKPLTTSSIVHVQFLAENALFSSLNFEFACRGYRVSLLKKKIASGKYQSEPDQSEPLQFFKRPSTDQNRMSLSTSLVA
ncbi:hypothetical protein I4U23_014675 [Adineta vaga]|nr:hypothetical protein I4U23_014675 [Adineta vaga]